MARLVEPQGKREQNKLANRAAILEAAKLCFIEMGYDAVTVRDVIRRTGLAAGTFYNYFRDKEELFRAIVEDRIVVLTQQLHEVRTQARSLQDFVHGAYLVAFTTVAEDPVLYHLTLRNEAIVRALYKESVLGISVRVLADDIRDAIRRGIMPALNVDYLASALFGAAYEMGRVVAESPHKDPRAAADFATRLFLGGIQAFGSPNVAKLKPRVRAG